MSSFFTGVSALGLPPGSAFVFQVIPHGDGTFDVYDTRNRTVAANFATNDLATADAITRNSALDAI